MNLATIEASGTQEWGCLYHTDPFTLVEVRLRRAIDPGTGVIGVMATWEIDCPAIVALQGFGSTSLDAIGSLVRQTHERLGL